MHWRILLTAMLIGPVYASPFQIFSVQHELPLTNTDEKMRKNYYVNIGDVQGVKKGTVLNVFRTISRLNPYDDRRRVNFRVKIGELTVLQTYGEASIASQTLYLDTPETPIFRVPGLMIGDRVEVSVKK